LGAGIRLITACPYNHAGIIVGDKVFESLENGIVSAPLLQRLDEQDILIKRFKYPSKFHPDHIESVAMRSEGVVKYDYKNTFIYQLIFRLTGVWIGSSSTNEMICTEFVARCYAPHYEFGPNLEKISPKEIYLNPDFFTVFKGKFSAK
jgi:hypothetical protein